MLSGMVIKMPHDEKPSDVWWHNTDSMISKMYDVVCTFGGTDIPEFAEQYRSIKINYKEALTIDNHRKSSGIITDGEFEETSNWYSTGNILIEKIYGSFLQFSKSVKDISDDEIEAYQDKFTRMAIELREHTRNRYLSDRIYEERENNA